MLTEVRPGNVKEQQLSGTARDTAHSAFRGRGLARPAEHSFLASKGRAGGADGYEHALTCTGKLSGRGQRAAPPSSPLSWEDSVR